MKICIKIYVYRGYNDNIIQLQIVKIHSNEWSKRSWRGDIDDQCVYFIEENHICNLSLILLVCVVT